MRVLMITSTWPSPGRPCTTHFIKRQAEAVRAAGVDLTVFRFHGRRNPLRYAGAWFRLRRSLARTRYDVVHAQFGQSGLLALPTRAPLVVTFRGSDLLGIVDDATGRHTARGRALQWASGLVARRADVVLLVSEHMRTSLPPGVRYEVMPSGVDLELFTPTPRNEARARLGLPLDRRLVLFAGRPTQARKRYGLAARAVELLSRTLPAELLVAWGVPHEEVPLYMSAADALVFTSMQEGSPNVVKEALACDLPVVSVPVGDVAERLDGIEGCELCADDRAETIAAALERVLVRGGRIDARDRMRALDEQSITRRLLDVYAAAAGRPAAASPAREATHELV